MQDIRKSSSWWTGPPNPMTYLFFFCFLFFLRWKKRHCLSRKLNSKVGCLKKKKCSFRILFVMSQFYMVEHCNHFFFFGKLSLLTGLLKNFCKCSQVLLEGLTSGLFGLPELRWGKSDFTSEPRLWLFGSCCHGVSVQGEVWKENWTIYYTNSAW